MIDLPVALRVDISVVGSKSRLRHGLRKYVVAELRGRPTCMHGDAERTRQGPSPV